VAEPSELFRLKCASHRYTTDNNSTHFKQNNSLVCRVSARYNHGSTGSRQVYLARRRVYNHSTAPQLLILRHANVITNLFQTECKLIQTVFNRTSYIACPSSQRKEHKHATTHVAKVDTVLVSLRRVTASRGRIPLYGPAKRNRSWPCRNIRRVLMGYT
jgi:hypothetical protein